MLESPALIACLHDVAVVREAVEQGGCHLGVAEDAAPFREGEVGGDHHARSLVELGEQVEQHRTARLRERQVGVVCGRGRNPTLRLWPTIFSGKIDVFPGDRRSRLISSMTSVAPA